MVHLKERLSNPADAGVIEEARRIVQKLAGQPPLTPDNPGCRRFYKLSDDDVRSLARAYEAGATVSGLAQHLGVHRTTVMAALDRERVGRRIPGRVLSIEEVERASNLYREGLGLRAVGDVIGADYRVVRRELIDAGVKLRYGRSSQAYASTPQSGVPRQSR